MSIVVQLSSGREISGYDITNQTRQLGLSVSPGTVYNQFRRLEKEGIINSRLVQRGRIYKTVYKATEEGEKALKDFIDKWEPILLIQHVIIRAKTNKTTTT
jgi:DNA-binding PadR family transcriptional regulator